MNVHKAYNVYISKGVTFYDLDDMKFYVFNWLSNLRKCHVLYIEMIALQKQTLYLLMLCFFNNPFNPPY